MDTAQSKKIAMRVSVISIAGNIVLSAGKLIAGVIGHSSAMISDAVHSASDVLSTIVVMVGINISSKKEDNSHQYGHERMECIAAFILAGLLFATGLGIGFSGIEKIMHGGDLQAPGLLPLIAAVASIIVKEAMYWFTVRAAKKINSASLKADAWHHRSDALSSVGSFVGILGARMGFPILDPIASVLICLMIIKVSYDIVRDAIDKLVDKSCDDETIRRMQTVIMEQDGVMGVDLLKTRLFGSKIYVDVEICADGGQTLTKAHEIAESVHQALERDFPEVKHCMVHVNPKLDEPDAAQEQQNKG